jgi:hypothetical protein
LSRIDSSTRDHTWRASRARVLLQVRMIVVTGKVVEARDRGCWKNRHITRQRKLVVVAIVRDENQGVHIRREGVAPRQRHRAAEDGSFGREEDFLTEAEIVAFLFMPFLLARPTNERAWYFGYLIFCFLLTATWILMLYIVILACSA